MKNKNIKEVKQKILEALEDKPPSICSECGKVFSFKVNKEDYGCCRFSLSTIK